MNSLRQRFWWAEDGTTTVVTDGDDVRWWTFAGLRANVQLADQLGDLTRGVRSRDNLSIPLAAGTSLEDAITRARALHGTGSPRHASPQSEQEGALPKFAECLPRDLALRTASARAADPISLNTSLREPARAAQVDQ